MWGGIIFFLTFRNTKDWLSWWFLVLCHNNVPLLYNFLSLSWQLMRRTINIYLRHLDTNYTLLHSLSFVCSLFHSIKYLKSNWSGGFLVVHWRKSMISLIIQLRSSSTLTTKPFCFILRLTELTIIIWRSVQANPATRFIPMGTLTLETGQ